MRDLTQLIKKNFTILSRSKSALLIVFLAPLLLILVAGLAFDTQQFTKLKVGYFNEGSSVIQEPLVNKLTQNSIKILKFKEEKDCVKALHTGKIHTCLSFFDEDQLILYVDYSNLNMAGEVLHLISSQIAITSSELSFDTAKNLVKKFEFARQELKKNKDIIISFATDNEESNQMIERIISIIQSSGKPLNLTLLQGINVDIDNNDFVAWYTKIDGLIGGVGQEYRSVSNDVLDKINEIAISETDKQELISIVDDGKDTIREIEDKIRLSGTVAYDELGDLGGLLATLIANVESLQSKLDTLSGFRETSVAKLRSIQNALDNNLIKLLELQKTFNVVEDSFNTIRLTDPDDLLSPIKTTIKPIANQGSGLHYVYPFLLALIIMFSGIFLSLSIVSWDRNSPASFRNYMTPLHTYLFPLSLFCTCLIIVGIQMGILFLIGSFFYGLSLFLALPALAFLSLPFTSVFILLGMSLSLFKKESLSSLMGITLCSFFLILSDIIIPFEKIPIFFAQMFSFNPFVLGTSVFKKILLLNLPFFSLFLETGILFLYCLILILFLYKKWGKR